MSNTKETGTFLLTYWGSQVGIANALGYLRGYIRLHRFSRPPIIIGGCERSGTTLLQAVLSAHKRIYCIPEELWAFCYGPRAGFATRHPIRITRMYKYLGTHPIPDYVWRWCEKSPANIFYFDEILDYFGGNVRLIQIVRDGRDVVSSMHPKKQTEPWVPIERWKAAVGAGLRYRDRTEVMTIRYQDLVLRYQSVARELCRFLGEEFSEEIVDWHSHARMQSSTNLREGHIGRIHSTSIHKFRRPDFRYGERVAKLMADPEAHRLLEAYGFLRS